MEVISLIQNLPITYITAPLSDTTNQSKSSNFLPRRLKGKLFVSSAHSPPTSFKQLLNGTSCHENDDYDDQIGDISGV